MRPLKIAIATIGRFWVLDLARELSAIGHEISFWSSVTRRGTAAFGLPAEAHRTLLPRMLPLLALRSYAGNRLSEWANQHAIVSTDRQIARRLEPCDVFIGMSGVAVESARAARTRYGAKVFIERGSRHIRSQKAILNDLTQRGLAAETVPEWALSRELEGYELADKVVIPALHVEQSFLEEGFPAGKLFRNPYGVDLSMFTPTPPPPIGPPTILFVGAWSYRKGVDLLVAAWRQLDGIRLLHVGAVVDAPLPDGPGFTHIDPVPQSRLREFYGQAHLFVLASREEGLSLVQAQALACGLPLVCTSRTGGEDLQRMIDDPSWVTVVPCDDVTSLTAAIRSMLPRALCLQGQRQLLGGAREQLGWRAYGRRYADELDNCVASRT